ncbi:uncharacterized protein [Cherax quadricarinatus]|uniref:uncharacterized protein n=1 Tax=Cherax quadricarinatus TaxID=27406 RepID=UPI0023795537|nr:uncharacterized protein LOC128697955 [Cherax quadricarinatus]
MDYSLAYLILILQAFSISLPVAALWPSWNTPSSTTTTTPSCVTDGHDILRSLPDSSSVITLTTLSPVTADSPRHSKLKLGVVVAQELLRLLLQYSNARFKRDLPELQATIIAKDSIKLGLLAYMGYQGEEDCSARAACEAGELLGRYTPSVTILFAALDYFTPGHMRSLLHVAKEAAEGDGCFNYRCGTLPYQAETT